MKNLTTKCPNCLRPISIFNTTCGACGSRDLKLSCPELDLARWEAKNSPSQGSRARARRKLREASSF